MAVIRVPSLAVYASDGQGTLHIAPEKSPPGTLLLPSSSHARAAKV